MLCGGQTRRRLFAATVDGDPFVDDFVCTNARHREHGEIVQCTTCGLVYAHPQPTASELLRLYSETVDPTYANEKAFRITSFGSLHDRFLAPHVAAGRTLDVGCHLGAYVEVAARRGLDAWGIDPSAWAVGEAHKAGLQVERGTLAEFPDSLPEVYELVTMWDVIEHLPAPRESLVAARDRLAPGGLLALTTMDISSRFARVLGSRWPWLMRMHLFYFDPRTLRRLLEETGFEILHIRPCGRVVSLGYLAFKLASYAPRTARLASRTLNHLRLAGRGVTVNFRDIMIAVARRR